MLPSHLTVMSNYLPDSAGRIIVKRVTFVRGEGGEKTNKRITFLNLMTNLTQVLGGVSSSALIFGVKMKC